MPVMTDKIKEFERWQKEQREEGMQEVVNQVLWVFDLIDSRACDIKSVVGFFLHTGELTEMHGLKKDHLHLTIKTVSDFHEKGSLFRYFWNNYFKGEEFALKAEMNNEIYNPLSK